MSEAATPAKRASFAAPRTLYFLIFAVSGFSGLIYESIWSHYLKLFLGHAAYAQSLVLIIFMGGMALGSWLASRFSERSKSLLSLYALIELIVGIAALVFHGLFTSLIEAFYSVFLPAIDAPLIGATLKWLAASLLIMPQSILLGMTFPLMSAGIIRRYPDSPGGSIAMLYFTNSIGAAIGVLASGFWLIRAVGLPGTIASAGLINIMLAGTVMVLVRLDPKSATRPIEREPAGVGDSSLAMLFIAAAFITGAASFIYEIAWIRMLSLVLGSTTHSFELMLSAFITGLAFGGLWIRKRIDAIASPVRFSGFVQLIMGLFALATIPVYILSFDWMAWLMGALENSDAGYAGFSLASHAIALAVMLPTTFMAGMTLPLFTFVLIKRGGGEASIGRVYAANTVGAIIGVLFAVHIGLPQLGLKNLIVFGAMLDIGLGLVLLSRISGERGRSLRYSGVGGVIAIALALGVANLDPKLLASGVYRFGNTDTLATAEILYYEDGKTASIALSEHANGALIVTTNGKSDAAVQADRSRPYAADEITMTLLGSLGLAYRPDATNVANIGMGSGMTTHTVLAKRDVQTVDTIEIEPAVVEASEGFGELVSRAYDDPRSHIYIEDAKTYFSLHNGVYDVIIAEPSNPWVSGVASLFSTEFYNRVGNHLEDDGVFVQWIQLYEFNDELAISILKAMAENFSDFVIYAVDDGNIILVASKNGRMGKPQWSVLLNSGIESELARVDVRTAADLDVRIIADRALLDAFLQQHPAPANSDYYPYVDLNAGRARFEGSTADLFSSWLRAPLPVLEMLGGRQPDFTAIVRTGHLNRLASILAADWLYNRIVIGVSEETLADNGVSAPEEYSLLATWLRQAADYCEDDFDLNRWFVYVQELMVAGLPFSSPENGASLIDAVDRSQCEGQQFPLIVSWFDLYRAVAERDAAAMSERAGALLEIMPADAPGKHRSYLLDAAMLGAIASGDVTRARALWSQYALQMYGASPVPGHMKLLSGIASASLPRK
ncbi:MAG: spermidine synthase [Woeseia sp.]